MLEQEMHRRTNLGVRYRVVLNRTDCGFLNVTSAATGQLAHGSICNRQLTANVLLVFLHHVAAGGYFNGSEDVRMSGRQQMTSLFSSKTCIPLSRDAPTFHFLTCFCPFCLLAEMWFALLGTNDCGSRVSHLQIFEMPGVIVLTHYLSGPTRDTVGRGHSSG